MSRTATAFAPGHVTGFFEIRDEDDDPYRAGSRGAGFSVALGVRSTVTLEDAGVPGVDVRVDGKPAEATTTRRAIGLLLGHEPLVVRVEQVQELPVSQGFGVSSAAALSATIALAAITGRSRADAVRAAHAAEVLQRTGLGDVVGASQGGFETRVKPGGPGEGDVRPWSPQPPVTRVALTVVADAVETRRVLRDADRRRAVNATGGGTVDAFAAHPTLESFIASCRHFAKTAGLSNPAVERALALVGPWSAQAQLGNSVFAFNPTPEQVAALQTLGPTWVTSIDAQGARLVS